jgi:peptidase inhibitor family I36
VLAAALCQLGLVVGCSAAPSDLDSSGLGQATQGLSSSEWLVAFRTSDGVHYLTAENDGGGSVSADRTAVRAWEYFIVADLDGGALLSGDRVQIRHVSADGASFWLTADVNGGGPGSILRANRSIPRGWETFIISQAGGGVVASGSAVNLRAATHPSYVSAEKGGGVAGDGAVTVNRSAARAWETFTVVAITAADLCPFSDTLCLFDHANFGGERFNVRALDSSAGTCVNLAEHGWAARARSAVNTNSRSAAVFPNPECTGAPVGINGLEATLPLLPNAAFVF